MDRPKSRHAYNMSTASLSIKVVGPFIPQGISAWNETSAVEWRKDSEQPLA
jgi:hypothetical protein